MPMAALSGSKLEHHEFKTKASFRLSFLLGQKDAFFISVVMFLNLAKTQFEVVMARDGMTKHLVQGNCIT